MGRGTIKSKGNPKVKLCAKPRNPTARDFPCSARRLRRLIAGVPADLAASAMAPSVSERPRCGDSPPFFTSAHSLAASVLSLLPFSPFNATPTAKAATAPVSCRTNGSRSMTLPFLLPASGFSSHGTMNQGTTSPSGSAIRSFASGVRIEGLVSSSKGGGGPAFVGQVFSMLDPSGNGLMAVTTRFDIPFLTNRAPAWIKKMLESITGSDKKGPVFRFFMDLGDAVSYVKHLNVPTGMVGACRLDVAYEHFKEKPHMFQFVPNQKQVKAANELLKQIPRKHGRRKVDGVPVFTAHNLNIAIATNDGLKWYIPYFFDKNLLDNILEASIDQHFHTMIQNRHKKRRRDAVDDNLTADAIEEYSDSLFEPPEVQEMMDEMGQYGIPLSVISKAAEIQLLDVVDKVLLGNRWLRKATGIQPKFPYLVDSFEERSATSSARSSLRIEDSDKKQPDRQFGAPDPGLHNDLQGGTHDQSSNQSNFKFPFHGLFRNPWTRQHQEQKNLDEYVNSNPRSEMDATSKPPQNPLLPKITMVGISMSEGHMDRTHLKKTMEDLTNELEQASNQSKPVEEMDPLFIANVGDYSSLTRLNSS